MSFPSVRPFSLLTRGIFKDLILLFLICLGGFLSLLVIGKLLQLRELFMVQGLSLVDLLRLFVYLSPFFLLLLLPVACMLCVFLTVLRMGTDRELIALRASGISLYRLLPGPVLFLVLGTAANFLISFHGISWGMDRFRDAILELARTKSELVLQPGVFNQDFPGLTIYAQNVDRGKGLLETVLVEDRTNRDVTAVIVAPEGRLLTDRVTGSIVFSLRNGRIYRHTSQELNILKFTDYKVTLDLSRLVNGFKFQERRPKEMSWAELVSLRKDPKLLEREGRSFTRNVAVEVEKRLVLPLACLALGLFAIPMASVFQGLRQQFGLVLALGCFLFYYSLLSMGLNLGETGILDPRIGMWIPNAVFLLLTILGLPLAVKGRGMQIMDWLRHLRPLQTGGRQGEG